MNLGPSSPADRSPLWQRIRACGMQTVAVMGMSKNTGKTVVLNHLLAAAAADHMAVGLTSIGRDGEATDAVFAIPKPPVRVWPGMLVATAQGTLLRSKVRTQRLGHTGVHSPMGEIVLVKVLQAGEMEVAGASRGHDQLRVMAQLRQCGAALVLIDGALGRSHHASPAMADGVVLATGAALGGGLADVLRKTRERLALLNLPAADALTRQQLGHFFDAAGVGLWAANGQPIWQAEVTSLNAAAALLKQAATRQPGLVAVTGAVGRQLWAALETLALRHPGLRIVVADGTRLFVDAADLQHLQHQGAQLMAWRAITLAGISVNPFSPLGGHLDATELLAAARRAFPGHVVTDVLLADAIQRKK
ncbi:MAG: hypothetical protein FD135_3137 [Comamonadaceae bacterium]|nr:MAG: hypothetical protein FD135_3137 [Comamonadaceae bacterium]